MKKTKTSKIAVDEGGPDGDYSVAVEVTPKEDGVLEVKQVEVKGLDPWKGAYWTCFYNAGRDVSKFHVTHKYFGQLEDQQEVDDIKYIVDAFFEVNPKTAKEMVIAFNIPEQFDSVPGSGDGLVKVYRSDDTQIEERFSSLRESFLPYAKDTYPVYVPHLTAEKPNTVVLNRYALCLDDEVLKVWELTPTK